MKGVILLALFSWRSPVTARFETFALALCEACSLCILLLPVQAVDGATIFESSTLGPTGLSRGDTPAANVSSVVFSGVIFQLTAPVVTTRVGGHFVDWPETTDSLFGAIVKLDDQDDMPDSGDLSTPDVLGSTVIGFPEPSSEVFGSLNVALDPGWYALVFCSGLFEAVGEGAMPLNNTDIGNPTYIAFQPSHGWFNLSVLSDAFNFVDFRFVVHGYVVPESSTTVMIIWIALMAMHIRKRTAITV